MKQSQLFYKTKKGISKEAAVLSHKLLLKADFIAQISAGIYVFLPLGWRVLKKIEKIIREEMIILEAQEVCLPALVPKNLWSETGRWQTIEPPLFKLKDCHKAEFGLGSTHEEVITAIIRQRIKSYKDLPIELFQIQNKFRNEIRSTGGLLRTREFMMKDLYSFHSTQKDLESFYEKVKKTYFKIFRECGLNPFCVEASSGSIGGKLSHEFMEICPVGEDKILICKKCGFGANLEKTGEIKKCPKCKSLLEKENSIEIGHIFDLGTKYSKAMKADFITESGLVKPIIMGCFGIGLGRLMAAIVEKNYDKKGIIWPKSVAPFDIHLIPIFSRKKEIDKEIKRISEQLYQTGQKEKIEVLYDDRKEISPGEKFVEADLIGIPIRVVVSEKTIKKNSVELKRREEMKTKLIKIKT